MSEDIIYRPIPVAQIKSNLFRRILIVVMYVPIVLLTWVIHTVRSILWFVSGIVRAPIKLAKSGAEYWNSPRND